MAYLLGLDAGNTMVKAVLFSIDGVELAVAEKGGSTRHPRPGHVERDLDELWACAAAAIRGCIARAGIDPAEIAAIGCAGHGNGLYALDRDRQPLMGIQSIDVRAGGLVERWNRDGTTDRICRLALQRPWAAQLPTLLSHIRETDPETFARIGTAFTCKDYIAFRLTGEVASDETDMSGAACLKLPDGRYDDELLAAYGLEGCGGILPPVHRSSAVTGRVTARAAADAGLAAGTPVVGGLFDVIASALGSGVVRTGAASLVAGTWSINQVIVDEPIRDNPPFITSVYEGTRFMEVEASATSAANLEWFMREWVAPEAEAAERPYDMVNRLAGTVRPSADLPIFHPFLFGAGDDAAARAGFFGLAGWHQRADLMFSLFEGVAFGHRAHVDNLRHRGISVEDAVLSGGGARSRVWSQIFADVLNLPVTVTRCQETGALGAAMVAGVGAGIFPDFAAAAARMVVVDRAHEPDAAAAEIHDRRYGVYTTLVEALRPHWKRWGG